MTLSLFWWFFKQYYRVIFDHDKNQQDFTKIQVKILL